MPQGEYLQYGGQAIVEGVMMRSPNYFAIACRAPNGEIVSTYEHLEKTWIGRQKWLKLPFLRGSLAILDAMALGTKAMRFASNVQIDPKYSAEPDPLAEEIATDEGMPQPAAVEKQIDEGLQKPAVPSQKVQEATVGAAMFGGIAIGLLLFNYLPNIISENAKNALKITDYRYTNLISEVVKVCIFLGYIYLISKVPEIGKVFMYHGAEHKAINTLEADQELDIANCKAQTRLHPRCGTSFAIVVLLISMFVFTFVPRYPFAATFIRFILEILVLPLVAGAAYELIRIAGKFRGTTLIKALFWPGLMTQYLTTKEPDESQIEVALASLKLVVNAEKADKEESVNRSEPLAV